MTRNLSTLASVVVSLMLLSSLIGCGSAKHDAKLFEGFTPVPSMRVRIGQVTDAVSSSGALAARKNLPDPAFDPARELRAQLEREVDRVGLGVSPAAVGEHLTLDAKIIDYWPGSAFTRWLAPGVGKTVLEIECKLMAGGREVGTAYVRRSVDAGGGYTANAWRFIFYIAAGPGCIVVPIPHKEGPVAGSRRVIDEADTDGMRPGVTRREEVLLRLGQPELRWREDRVLVYSWTTSNLLLLWAFGGAYGGGGAGAYDSPISYFLLAEFDERNTLRRFETKTAPPFVGGDTYAERLYREW